MSHQISFLEYLKSNIHDLGFSEFEENDIIDNILKIGYIEASNRLQSKILNGDYENGNKD